MTGLNPLLMLLKQQASQIDTLEGKVLDLECALGFDKVANVQRAFGLTETLAKLLLLLDDGMPRNRESILAGLYYDRPGGAPEAKLLDSHFYKLRKRLASYSIEIATVFSRGYQIVSGADLVRIAAETLQTGESSMTPKESYQVRRTEYRRVNPKVAQPAPDPRKTARKAQRSARAATRKHA